jgi:hypothetical protein
MATSTSYNASYVGVVQGLSFNRPGMDNTKLAATANTIALQFESAFLGAVLSAAKQNLLTQIIASFLSGRYTEGAMNSSSVNALMASYTTLTANIVD